MRPARRLRAQTKNSNPGKTSAVSAHAGEEKAETLRSLNTNAGYENWYAQLSPRTRAAWEEYQRLEAPDQEEGYLCYDDPEHELYQDPEAQWDEEVARFCDSKLLDKIMP